MTHLTETKYIYNLCLQSGIALTLFHIQMIFTGIMLIVYAMYRIARRIL